MKSVQLQQKTFIRLSTLLLFVVMMFILVPVARADTGSATISSDGTYDLSSFGNGATITINDRLTVSLTNTLSNTYTDMRISCGEGVSLTIDGVQINNTSDNCYAISFSGAGNHLYLVGDSTLSSGENAAGILVNDGTSLEISGTGSLEVFGGDMAAGIGGGYRNNGGTITMEDNAQVTATGGDYGAGIGGGCEGNAGAIVIEGSAEVAATGGYEAAGIGGGAPLFGNGGSSGTITIRGGNVTAKGGYCSAGIGCGGSPYDNWIGGDGGLITISGGMVTATGGQAGGAGIGGASYRNGGTVAINGGTVTAKGGYWGAGIGSGDYGEIGTITISGGTITASSTYNKDYWGGAAGIGSGRYGIIGSITIGGGTVVATGEDSGTGIGGAYYSRDSGNITISGGTVAATGGVNGAGIGGGYGGGAGTIDISGGIVFAKKGDTAPHDIGCGNNGSGGSLLISGHSTVFLKGGLSIAPTTTTHLLKTASSISNHIAFGYTLPDSWTAPVYAYINSCYHASLQNTGIGTVSASGTFLAGSTVTITATPDSGYTFAGWTVESGGMTLADESSAATTFTMPECDVSVTAVFTKTTNAVTLQNNGNGTATGNGTYAWGDQVTLTATANSGYQFMYWEVVSGGVVIGDALNMTTAFTMPQSDVTITAIFDTNPTEYDYTVSSEKATITRYRGNAGDITIPYKLGGYRVTGIGKSVFENKVSITSIRLPTTLETIGAQAFAGCSSLSGALVIPDSVKYIEEWAFSSCGLNCVTLGKGVSSFGETVFQGCPLTSLTVDQNNPYIKSVDNVLFNKSGTELIYCTDYRTGSYTIPQGVTNISDYAFYDCHGITGLDLGKSVESIGRYAFSNTDISTINIPKSVKSIGDNAFFHCPNLKSAYFLGTKPTLGTTIFQDASASGFKLYYHISNCSSWSSYSGETSQAFCKLTKGLQDGSAPQSTTVNLDSGYYLPLQVDPMPRIGYTFAGWYKEKDCQNKWGFATDTVINDVTLYAKWTEGTHSDVTTQEGNNVSINDNNSGVSLTFDTVNSGGETTIETLTSKPSDANFHLSESCGYYNIETTATFSGAVTITLSYDPSKIIEPESTLRLYQFKDGTSVDITVLVDTDINTITGLVTDHFCAFAVGTPESDTINTLVNHGSYGTATGGGIYHHGDPVTLHATANKGYHFVRWENSGREVSTSANYSFTATENMTLTAVFTINSYAVTADANNAAYGMVTGAGTYDYDAPVTLRATPNNGYRFVRWKENGTAVCTNVNYPFSVTGNRSLVAEFSALTAVNISCLKTDVTLYSGSDGTVTMTASGGDSGTYEYSINGGTSWQNSNVFAGLQASTYSVVVRDAVFTGNVATCSVTVGQASYMGSFAANKIPAKANAGTAIHITAPVPPKNATIKSIAYLSSNLAVAAVDSHGNVTFLAGGKVTITLTIVSQAVNNKGTTMTKMTAIKKAITVNLLVKTITLNMPSATVARTKTVKLKPQIGPSSATNKKVKWTSNNPKVATVSSTGVVTGKARGIAIIICTAQDGSKVLASCVVNVTSLYPSGIKLSKKSLQIKLGKTGALKATVLPSNSDFKMVSWASSNPGVAAVDNRGRITGVSAGTAVITVETTNGLSTSCTVTIK